MRIERNMLRSERAIVEICRSMKWDPNNLTPTQLARIVEELRIQRGIPSSKTRRSS